MPRKGGRRKKTRTHVKEEENQKSALASHDKEANVPRSAIYCARSNNIEPEVTHLVSDLREMMRPFTALSLPLKEPKKKRKRGDKNSLQTLAKEVTGTFGVTHLMALSQHTDKNDEKTRVGLKLARTPAGPTLSFQVRRFSLIKHVRAIQRRPFSSATAFQNPPIVVTNHFGNETASPHVKLMRITFQNLFPAINVATAKLSEVRRVVLFNLIASTSEEEHDSNTEGEEEFVEVRHYAIRATPVGVDRKVRRVVQAKIPNLSKLSDISDYIMGSSTNHPSSVMSTGDVSESEAEDETTHVVLSQKYAGKGNCRSQTSALKLVEIGPRLKLQLVKVEKGLGEGDVMYHAFVNKTEEEVNIQKKKFEEAALLKKMRREEQERNVQNKKKSKEEKKAAKKARREERLLNNKQGISSLNHDDDNSDESDDDVESHEE